MFWNGFFRPYVNVCVCACAHHLLQKCNFSFVVFKMVSVCVCRSDALYLEKYKKIYIENSFVFRDLIAPNTINKNKKRILFCVCSAISQLIETSVNMPCRMDRHWLYGTDGINKKKTNCIHGFWYSWVQVSNIIRVCCGWKYFDLWKSKWCVCFCFFSLSLLNPRNSNCTCCLIVFAFSMRALLYFYYFSLRYYSLSH